MERRNRRVGDERMIKCRCGSEAAESLKDLETRMSAIGYHVTVSRGDSLNI